MVLGFRRFADRLPVAVLFAILGTGALAQSAPPARPSGSVNIHQVQIAFIGSGTMGGGTLYFRGRAYPFKLGGLGIGGIGISTIDAVGTVYNLRRLEDFNGVTVRPAPAGRSANRARAGCGCRIQTASI